MALINCPDCNKGVSDMSVSCINCGCPINIAITQTPENANTAQPTAAHYATPQYFEYKTLPTKEKKNGSLSALGVIFIVIIIVVLFFSPTSCNIFPGNRECSGLRTANRYIDGISGELNTRVFRDSYWHGFWSVHADCSTCRRNGDVPTRYR
jgi:hypothetical protein